MLRRDPTARFQRRGFAIFARYRFHAGGLQSRRTWHVAAVKRLLARQQETPVPLLVDEETRRTWWMFRGEFHWEDEGFDEREVKALLLERIMRRDRRLQRALALMDAVGTPNSLARTSIPDDVKLLVWKRDGGRCVKCGGGHRLEFDHIVPLALGGGNTARNLQILCETCNRSKGAAIA